MKRNGEPFRNSRKINRISVNMVILVNMVNRVASEKFELLLIDFQGLDSVGES
jgi:hypothetical protein